MTEGPEALVVALLAEGGQLVPIGPAPWPWLRVTELALGEELGAAACALVTAATGRSGAVLAMLEPLEELPEKEGARHRVLLPVLCSGMPPAALPCAREADGEADGSGCWQEVLVSRARAVLAARAKA